MEWLKQFAALFLSVFILMVVIYIIKRVGTGIPIVDDVVGGVLN